MDNNQKSVEINYTGHGAGSTKFGTENVIKKLKAFRGSYCPINNKAAVKMNKSTFVAACRKHVENSNKAIKNSRTSELGLGGFISTNDNVCSRCGMRKNLLEYDTQSQKKGVKPVQLKITLPDGITLFTEKELKAFNTKR